MTAQGISAGTAKTAKLAEGEARRPGRLADAPEHLSMTQSPDTPRGLEELAGRLTEAQRDAWIWTVLAVAGTAGCRRAFIAGYNGAERPKPSSANMRRYYDRGVEVQTILHPTALRSHIQGNG